LSLCDDAVEVEPLEHMAGETLALLDAALELFARSDHHSGFSSVV
jgi:hypothetical protein